MDCITTITDKYRTEGRNPIYEGLLFLNLHIWQYTGCGSSQGPYIMQSHLSMTRLVKIELNTIPRVFLPIQLERLLGKVIRKTFLLTLNHKTPLSIESLRVIGLESPVRVEVVWFLDNSF